MIQKYLNKLEYNLIIENLIKNCRTFIGKEIASKLEPSSNVEKVSRTLEETSEAVNLFSKYGSFPISEIDDLTIGLKQIESYINLSAKNLLNFADILYMSKELKDYHKDAQEHSQYLDKYFDDLYINQDIERKIHSSILSEDTIADSASPKLNQIRRNKKNLELQIKNTLNKMIHSTTYSKYMMDPLVTIRNNRYVIPVKEEYRNQIKGFIHDTSSSGSTVYIEPMSVFEINNSINTLNIEEQHEIERILSELSNNLFLLYGFLKQNLNLIGKLDFISAKARYSIDNDCTKPEIGNFIELKNARHPLINKNQVVPINIEIGKTYRTLVITGPNTGGKTVTLKTVGLLSLMAQSGIHIPASDNSTIKIFDNIFADIGDEQSIEQSLSTFSSHMTTIVNILENFTIDSLILVDELGSGTDPIEGANLAISLLERFYEYGAFTLATTHYHEIKNYCLSNKGFENASAEFDIENMRPTYHILMGIPGKSNAFAISQRLGIPKEIIERASSLISKPDTDIETLMKDIYDSKIKIEEEKKEIEKNLNQIQVLRKSLENDVTDKLKHEKEKIEEARNEAKQILIDAKQEANEIISKLSKMQQADIKKAEHLRNKLNDSVNNSKAKGLDLSVLLSLNNKAPETLAKSSKTNSKVNIKNNKAQTIKSEINVIGETVAVATEIIDQYLDSCYMAGLKECRIIHGKGTGKLRQGIHEFLKKSRYVDEYYTAGFTDGDIGATIVKLKSKH